MLKSRFFYKLNGERSSAVGVEVAQQSAVDGIENDRLIWRCAFYIYAFCRDADEAMPLLWLRNAFDVIGNRLEGNALNIGHWVCNADTICV